MSLQPPPPTHILRSHSSPISALYISDDNERVYSGDAQGVIVITSSQTLRPIAKWEAHKERILGVEEWDRVIVTHARDNKLHVWDRAGEKEEEEPPAAMRIGSTAALVDLPTPGLRYSMDVNALNFCRFSLLRLAGSRGLGAAAGTRGLLALPNLVESGAADIWALDGRDRIHAAIGQDSGFGARGIIMSMDLYLSGVESEEGSELPMTTLRLLCGYENGSVVLWKYTRKEKTKSVDGAGWDMIWTVRLHQETIMAMRVSSNNEFALTVSVDHLVGKYDLKDESADPEKSCKIFRTMHPGNGCIAIHDKGRVCAIGGWDGRVRLYSTKSFKPLGTLRYHKVACQAVEFARASWTRQGDEEDEKEKVKQSRWLVSGGKDHRPTIWELMDFEKGDSKA
ncbi:hypothetical protein APHAL10511_007366 [Amanita phalloides]|nr:hypothetical protein APHAL10511_007366 [Amanita phalloides]